MKKIDVAVICLLLAFEEHRHLLLIQVQSRNGINKCDYLLFSICQSHLMILPLAVWLGCLSWVPYSGGIRWQLGCCAAIPSGS